MFLIRGYFVQILEGVLSRRCFGQGVLSEGVLGVYVPNKLEVVCVYFHMHMNNITPVCISSESWKNTTIYGLGWKKYLVCMASFCIVCLYGGGLSLTLEGRKRQLTPFDFLFSDILSSGISSNPVFSDFYFFMLTHISGKFQRSTFKNKKIRSMTT